MRAAICSLLLFAAGCFSPRYDAPLCAEDGSCPDGLRCGDDGVCGGATGVDAAEVDASDGGGADTASHDAAVDASDSGDASPDACGRTAELCNGADDNCDGTSDEGFNVGMPCDGADGDSCREGTLECDPGTGGIRCNDLTGTQLESCNNADDDCDVMIDEGFDLTSDELNCGVCGRACANDLGTTRCASSVCAPTCSAGANDCDGNPTTGCELRDTNPACASAVSLGSLAGDSGAATATVSGYSEAVYTVQLVETGGVANSPVRGQVTLTSPPGTNFDLDVTCVSCGGTTLSSNSTGASDVIDVRRDDRSGLTDNFTIIIAVRWTSSTACGNWNLTVVGNTGAAATQTCPP